MAGRDERDWNGCLHEKMRSKKRRARREE